jgi:hypothetical protein
MAKATKRKRVKSASKRKAAARKSTRAKSRNDDSFFASFLKIFDPDPAPSRKK